jgi:hypothetical protein
LLNSIIKALYLKKHVSAGGVATALIWHDDREKEKENPKFGTVLRVGLAGPVASGTPSRSMVPAGCADAGTNG